MRRVLEHLAAEGHRAELVAPTGPATYAGFPVTRSRGAHLPFYRDFRIGLETRGRLRAVVERFRPDVVHIASPATLGLQAARVADELDVPDRGGLPDRPDRVRRAVRRGEREGRRGCGR